MSTEVPYEVALLRAKLSAAEATGWKSRYYLDTEDGSLYGWPVPTGRLKVQGMTLTGITYALGVLGDDTMNANGTEVLAWFRRAPQVSADEDEWHILTRNLVRPQDRSTWGIIRATLVEDDDDNEEQA